ncbi:hypothetical protein FA15DRAFT_674231 [Coprinopsis marcescibilis]|uniref:Uncharacterized protein n=1 Tax=Coprinopsis marcescibilis TaxID=230819 RepID=A0A5C3KHH3_COPMA|nr:hypothetical protein FA15DRAFT_674231 [Coprinopsis marcescibilis]
MTRAPANFSNGASFVLGCALCVQLTLSRDGYLVWPPATYRSSSRAAEPHESLMTSVCYVLPTRKLPSDVQQHLWPLYELSRGQVRPYNVFVDIFPADHWPRHGSKTPRGPGASPTTTTSSSGTASCMA